MGGKVLDLPEIRIFHEGKAEGLKEGEAERKKLSEENANWKRRFLLLRQNLKS